nr:hypothetical protein Iba_chr14bCG10440 [Ipomoea batatas]
MIAMNLYVVNIEVVELYARPRRRPSSNFVVARGRCFVVGKGGSKDLRRHAESSVGKAARVEAAVGGDQTTRVGSRRRQSVTNEGLEVELIFSLQLGLGVGRRMWIRLLKFLG